MRTDREGENEDRGDEEQGQPVQEPDSLVENAQLGIAIGPQHPDTSISSLQGSAGRRSNRARAYSRTLHAWRTRFTARLRLSVRLERPSSQPGRPFNGWHRWRMLAEPRTAPRSDPFLEWTAKVYRKQCVAIQRGPGSPVAEQRRPIHPPIHRFGRIISVPVLGGCTINTVGRSFGSDRYCGKQCRDKEQVRHQCASQADQQQLAHRRGAGMLRQGQRTE
jgi:hypothetical protein